MNLASLFFSPVGRLPQRPFVITIVVVYLVSFFAQALLALPGSARVGAIAFGVVQFAVSWAWYALHAKRLRDAGDNVMFPLAFAILYALAMALLVVFVGIAAGGTQGATRNDFGAGGLVALVTVILVIASFAGDASLGSFYYFMLAFLALILLPVVLALAVSIWAATRPTVEAKGPSGMPQPGGMPGLRKRGP